MSSKGILIPQTLRILITLQFVISFENSSKLIEPILASTIPVYCGNYEVVKGFNTSNFIQISKFSLYEVEIELDNDNEEYVDDNASLG